MGAGQDKGKALLVVKKVYEKIFRSEVTSICAGDSENDYEMLKVCDRAVLIPKPDGRYSDISLPGIVYAKKPGSRGWGETIGEILETAN